MLQRVQFFIKAFLMAFGIMGIGSAQIVTAQLKDHPLVPTSATFLFEKTVNQPYTYQGGSRRDPFIPLPLSGSKGKSEFDEESGLGNSEEAVILLGIISGKQGYQALLKLPSGERLMVEPGSPLKHIAGKVKRITRDGVVIAKPLEANEPNRIVEESLWLLP